MSDYQKLEQYIISTGYDVKTDLDNLIWMCFGHYDSYLEENDCYADSNLEYIDDCIIYIEENGLLEFDYYC